jgi:hypothetical protein
MFLPVAYMLVIVFFFCFFGCTARHDVMTALYVIFLGIVPFVAVIAVFMYYTRRNVKYWWKKSSTHAAASAQSPLYVASRFCSSISGCLSRCSVPKLSMLNTGGGKTCIPQGTHLPCGISHSSHVNASPAAVRVKLEITKTGLISTTNADVMNTLQSEKNAQNPGFYKRNVNTSISSNRGHQQNKEIILAVASLLEPSASESLPVSKRKEMFMKSSTKEADSMPQTRILAKKNISSNINVVKPGSQNLPSSTLNSISKSDPPKRTRKNSKSLQLKVKHDPVKQKLVETSDSCPSTPETPPVMKLQRNSVVSSSRPTVAELSSKFETGSIPKA